MARDEDSGRRNTKKNTAIKKFQQNGKFNGKHVRAVQARLENNQKNETKST
jgi:hypothetical protein